MVSLALVAWPLQASAHSPIEGLGAFYGHLLHPVTVQSHAMLLTAVALMFGQQGRSKARAGVIALGLAFAGGLAAATTGASGTFSVSEPMFLLGALVVGGAVVLDLRVAAAVVVSVSVATGLIIGLGPAPATTGMRDKALGIGGVATGVLYLTIVITGFTISLQKHWQKIAVRVVGSWIFAVSMLVLAQTIAGPAKRVAAAAVGFLFG
ncbi:MAG: HupE/UreJ family protein [Alphaproteobacteria bacterium]|nr:HupE/UreJ family protein [Alphaproteobacteria bacterium]